MPYNNQAIPPTTEPLGAATLPLARVKKILAQDDEINSVAANSAFAITIATEMFIRYLAEKSYDVAKSDSKKPRRTIAYSDVAEAVARIDNLEFLQDLIPKTSTFGEFKAKKAAKSRMASSVLQAGQTTLDGKRPQPQQVLQTSPTPAEVMEVDNNDQAGPSNTEAAGGSQNGQPIVFEHYQGPNGTAPREQFSDVEMEQEH